MMNFFNKLVSRVQQSGKNLGLNEDLVNKTWCKLDENKKVFKQLEFQRNGTLIVNNQGIVSRQKWELTGSGKLLISDQNFEKFYSAVILEENQLSLQVVGQPDQFEYFFEEKFIVNEVRKFLEKLTTEPPKVPEIPRYYDKYGLPLNVINSEPLISPTKEKEYITIRVGNMSIIPEKLEDLRTKLSTMSTLFQDKKELPTHFQNQSFQVDPTESFLKEFKQYNEKVLQELEKLIETLEDPNTQIITPTWKLDNLKKSHFAYKTFLNDVEFK